MHWIESIKAFDLCCNCIGRIKEAIVSEFGKIPELDHSVGRKTGFLENQLPGYLTRVENSSSAGKRVDFIRQDRNL